MSESLVTKNTASSSAKTPHTPDRIQVIVATDCGSNTTKDVSA